MLDGKKAGATQGTLIGAFTNNEGKQVAKHTHTVHVYAEEETLAKRRGRVRGSASLDQMERAYMITRDIFEVPDKKRKHFPGSSRGNIIGPV
eukprot:1669497-Pyramimonas_sp.AAC.1